MVDKSSRPKRCRSRLTAVDYKRIHGLRKKRLTGGEIALCLGICSSTVYRALRKLNMSHLSSLEEKELIQRY